MNSEPERKWYDICLKCRGLDLRPEAECRCPKNTKEKIKKQAQEILEKRQQPLSTSTSQDSSDRS